MNVERSQICQECFGDSARACGLPVTPKKKKRSLALVAAWLADAAFPKKTRHGYLIQQIGSLEDEGGWFRQRRGDLFGQGEAP